MWLIVGKYAITMVYLIDRISTTTDNAIQKIAGVLSFKLLTFADSLKTHKLSSIPIPILMQEDIPGQISSPMPSGKKQISF